MEAATAEAVSILNRDEDAKDDKTRTSPDFKLGGLGGLHGSLPPTGLFPPPPPLPPPPPVSAAAAVALGLHEEALKAGGGPSSSPLQGMASITNSLTNQPLPAPYRPAQRSIKAILPPITQEQFDRYSDINTEELVRTVRLIRTTEVPLY